MFIIRDLSILSYNLLFALAIFTLLYLSPLAHAQSNAQGAGPLTEPFGSLNAQLWRVPVKPDDSGRIILLEATTFKPDGHGPFPLVIINHGSHDEAPRNGAWDYRPDSAIQWFLSKGYSVAVLIRSGYGRSEGIRVETDGCTLRSQDYVGEGEKLARDLLGAVEYFRLQPFVLANKIVLVGHSMGGTLSLAAASKSPQGVRGVIAFAPGANGNPPNPICDEDLVLAAVKKFGSTNTLPTLWIYLENDSYFGPEIARKLFYAYVPFGATGHELIILPSAGNEGHSLFLKSNGPDVWAPITEPFLDRILE